jgi:hypothetical protein
MRLHEKLAECGGWLAMVILHTATVPTSLYYLMGWSSHLPPLDMVLLVWTGLLLYFIRAAVNFDLLYFVSNTIGLTTQSVLLICVLFA